MPATSACGPWRHRSTATGPSAERPSASAGVPGVGPGAGGGAVGRRVERAAGQLQQPDLAGAALRRGSPAPGRRGRGPGRRGQLGGEPVDESRPRGRRSSWASTPVSPVSPASGARRRRRPAASSGAVGGGEDHDAGVPGAAQGGRRSGRRAGRSTTTTGPGGPRLGTAPAARRRDGQGRRAGTGSSCAAVRPRRDVHRAGGQVGQPAGPRPVGQAVGRRQQDQLESAGGVQGDELGEHGARATPSARSRGPTTARPPVLLEVDAHRHVRGRLADPAAVLLDAGDPVRPGPGAEADHERVGAGRRSGSTAGRSGGAPPRPASRGRGAPSRRPGRRHAPRRRAALGGGQLDARGRPPRAGCCAGRSSGRKPGAQRDDGAQQGEEEEGRRVAAARPAGRRRPPAARRRPTRAAAAAPLPAAGGSAPPPPRGARSSRRTGRTAVARRCRLQGRGRLAGAGDGQGGGAEPEHAAGGPRRDVAVEVRRRRAGCRWSTQVGDRTAPPPTWTRRAGGRRPDRGAGLRVLLPAHDVPPLAEREGARPASGPPTTCSSRALCAAPEPSGRAGRPRPRTRAVPSAAELSGRSAASRGRTGHRPSTGRPRARPSAGSTSATRCVVVAR